jgi:uncharacterized iron-regulated protein
MARVFVILFFVLGCSSQRLADAEIGGSPGSFRPDPEPAPDAGRRRRVYNVPDDAVERAALPFIGQRVAGAKQLAPEELFDALSRADAVCIGEQHDDPHHHYAELVLIQALAERALVRGRELALGLEMFEQQFQPALDRYASGVSDEPALLDEAEWDDRWGFAFALYRPELESARQRNYRLLALGARREYVQRVAQAGLDAFDAHEAKELPSLDFSIAEHREAFDKAMSQHPKTGKRPDDLYAAQLLRDEAMADAAARFIGERHPARQIVILAGLEHCRSWAIPARIQRRLTSAEVRSIRPIVNGPERDALRGFDYGFMMHHGD